MNKKIFFAIMVFATLAMVGCNKDKNDNPGSDVPERQDVTAFDDLEYFQTYFVNVDSLGNFVSRSIGIPLPVYDEDTTHIFIGVEDIDEALTYWDDCLPPIDEIRPIKNDDYPISYTLTDEQGRLQGTVSFAPSTEPGFVADITTDLPGLRHFKKVTFVQNDSWPVDYCPAQSKALMIAGIIGSNWQFFKDRFEAAQGGELVADKLYWFDGREAFFPFAYWNCIKLNNGEIDSWEYIWHEPFKHALLKVDWLDD